MSTDRSKPNASAAAAKLRELIWAASDGDLLGSEDELLRLLNVSRPTVRQAARLVEAEGLLKVRRGIHGGYFAARPSVNVIESALSAYLHTVVADEEEITEIASALWVIVAGKAATLESKEKNTLIERLRSKALALKDDAVWDELIEVEESTRNGMLALINSPYVDLIFHVNRMFASQEFPINPRDRDGTAEHVEYVRAWRKAKLLELDAIADGDREISQLAAQHSRKLFHKRLWGHARY